MKKRSKLSGASRFAAVLLTSLVLAACGGGGGGGDPVVDPGTGTGGGGSGGTGGDTGAAGGGTGGGGVTPVAGVTKTLFAAEPVGANCAGPSPGGVKITAFVDQNADGIINGTETSSVKYLCYTPPGAAGTASTAGLTTYANLTAEAAGTNCPTGGRRLSIGYDANYSGVLDAAEVPVGGTAFLCSNTTVTAGGGNLTVPIVDIPRGASCALAGKQVTVPGAAAQNFCYAAPGLANTWTRISGATATLVTKLFYIVDRAAGSALTLPATASIPANDTIRVRGETGNWSLVAPVGASVNVQKLQSLALLGSGAWTPQSATLGQNWWYLASSASGQKLAGVANAFPSLVQTGAPQTGSVWTSPDAGNTWIEQTGTGKPPTANWAGVASSADGNVLAVASSGGTAPGAKGIWVSNDSGVTWNNPASTNTGAGFWVSIAMSANGTRMAAVRLSGGVYTSDDSGVNWTLRTQIFGNADWRSLASSSTGQYLVAAVYTDYFADPRAAVDRQSVYVSSDFGVTWVPAGTQRFDSAYRVASSADGTRLAMAEHYGRIWYSTDRGVNWTASNAPDSAYTAIRSSADGSVVIAVSPDNVPANRGTDDPVRGATAPDGLIRISSNFGATFTALTGATPTAALWRGVAVSNDGNWLVAAQNNGRVYTNRVSTFNGAPASDVTLRHLGSGVYDASVSP